MFYRKIVVLIALFFSFNIATAAINDYYKEVMQRGYSIDGDSVVLPDSSKCSIDDFNNRLCGKEFFDLDYCVAEGNYVWDDEKCCKGLVAYLPEGVSGQATCRKKGKVDFSLVLRNPLLWLSILAFTAVVYGSLLVAKKYIKR
jgi:hypothetical protein